MTSMVRFKTKLTNTLGLSKQECAFRLRHFRLLGDSKPSTLMDEMFALLEDPCLLFRQLFLECLHANGRDVHSSGRPLPAV